MLTQRKYNCLWLPYYIRTSIEYFAFFRFFVINSRKQVFASDTLGLRIFFGFVWLISFEFHNFSFNFFIIFFFLRTILVHNQMRNNNVNLIEDWISIASKNVENLLYDITMLNNWFYFSFFSFLNPFRILFGWIMRATLIIGYQKNVSNLYDIIMYIQTSFALIKRKIHTNRFLLAQSNWVYLKIKGSWRGKWCEICAGYRKAYWHKTFI